jgi:hypothetical protein
LQKFSKNHVFEVLETFGKINLGVEKIFSGPAVLQKFSKNHVFEVLETFG